jgi:hypothetical protein
MKKCRSIQACTCALLFSAGVLPLAAQAQENSYDTEGVITYEQGNKPPIVTPPGTEGPEIKEPGVNPEVSPLMIIAATPIDFGQQENTTTAQTYYAKDFETTAKTGNDDKLTMENFVKFRDIRATDSREYKIYVQMTKQFTKDTSILKGAELNYSNLRLLTTSSNQDNMPALEDRTLASTIKLTPGVDGTSAGDPQLVYENNSVEKGFGIYDITFGEFGNNSKDSVKLNVPANLPILKGQYVSEMTWSITDTF